MTTSTPCDLNNLVDNSCAELNFNETGNLTDQIAPDIPYYMLIYVTTINAIILLVGVIGNVMVIIVVVKVKDMRSPMNYYLVSLSVADLLVLLICQPSALAEFYAKSRWYLSETAYSTIEH
ncbi:hypothetical protein LOTGIDRAFT_159778 [Lottia gigantea]|uniref:G-protein coupled receptors family 1 profile domain-containing protein n=1 Tax=Lottia gigantea TaxID=225164 RepID=V4AJ02_LOTGI|nr:hypothetical protein LOTGIDRAFT_159778 [Lottia gigantea]ESO97027.1 hypothetical protein LOTGIDRAFT_159778 [Lottia gigantea]